MTSLAASPRASPSAAAASSPSDLSCPLISSRSTTLGVLALAGLGVDEGADGRLWVVGEDTTIRTGSADELAASTPVDTFELATSATLRSVWVAPSGSV